MANFLRSGRQDHGARCDVGSGSPVLLRRFASHGQRNAALPVAVGLLRWSVHSQTCGFDWLLRLHGSAPRMRPT